MVQAHSDVVEFLVGALAKGSSLNLRIPSVHSFSQTVQNSGMQIIQASRSVSRLRMVQIMFSSVANGDKPCRAYRIPSGAFEAQMSIGSRDYPQHGSLRSVQEMFYQTLKCLGDVACTGSNALTKDVANAAYASETNTGKFVLAWSTANSPAAFDSISTKGGEVVSLKLAIVGSNCDKLTVCLFREQVLSSSSQSVDRLQ